MSSVIAFCFALWFEGGTRWKARAFSLCGVNSQCTKSAYILLQSEGFSLISSLFFLGFFVLNWGRPEEQMLKHCSYNSAGLIQKLQISISKFPKLWDLCYHKQKYDSLWRVTWPLTCPEQYLIPRGWSLRAWMRTVVSVLSVNDDRNSMWRHGWGFSVFLS